MSGHRTVEIGSFVRLRSHFERSKQVQVGECNGMTLALGSICKRCEVNAITLCPVYNEE